jgi:hypothetical protein
MKNIVNNKLYTIFWILIAGIWTLLFFYLFKSAWSAKTALISGDYPGHLYNLDVFLKHSLPNFRLVTWSPSQFLGEPLMVHYFPVPFLVMSILSFASNIEVGFNIGTWLPLYLMPFCMLYCISKITDQKSSIVVLAISFSNSALFIFNESFALWGGNGLSNLTGLFCQTYAIDFFLLFLGKLFSKKKSPNQEINLAALASLTLLSHSHVFLTLMVATLLFAIVSNEKFKEKLISYGKVGIIFFLFSAFYLFPMIIHRNRMMMNPHNLTSEDLKQMASFFLSPSFGLYLLIFITLSLFSLWKKKKEKLYSNFAEIKMVALSALLLLALKAYPLLGVDAKRGLPQIIVVILIAISSAQIKRLIHLTNRSAFVIGLSLFVFASSIIVKNQKKIQSWSHWSYSGRETKPLFYQTQKIFEFLKGDLSQPRILPEFNSFLMGAGTSGIFNLIPILSNRSIASGIYLDSSIKSKEVIDLQNSISSESF